MSELIVIMSEVGEFWNANKQVFCPLATASVFKVDQNNREDFFWGVYLMAPKGVEFFVIPFQTAKRLENSLSNIAD